MRPKITCHMITSLDGRLHPHRWSDPVGGSMDELVERHYESTAERLGAEGWIVGRKSFPGEAPVEEAPRLLDAPRARPAHVVDRAGRPLGVVIDPSGRLRHAGGEVEGDPIVAILSERVPDDYLAALRDADVSYVFAGPDGRDMGAALESLGAHFGVEHLLLEGGGFTNGAFLAAGLIDAVSVLICPAIDGQSAVPAIFEHAGSPDDRPAKDCHLERIACAVLEGGVVWLRHDVARA